MTGDALQSLVKVGGSRGSHSKELGRLVPHSFSQWVWYRFRKNRRELYTRDIGGPPSRRQAGLIDVLISCEWDWWRLDAEAKTSTGRIADEKMRMAAECRRQFLLADVKFADTLRAAAKAAGEATSTPSSPTLAQQLAALRRAAPKSDE